MGHTEDARLQLARTLLNNNSYAEAGELLHSLTADQPGNLSAWFLLGACQHQSGQLTPALESFSKAIKLSPRHLQAQSARAQILFERGAWLDSLQRYEALTRLDPQNPTHWLHCSVVLDALALPDDALEYLDEALRINPQYKDALINKANLLSRQKQPLQALDIYNQLLSNQPEDATLLANRADIHLSVGDLSRATIDLEAALRINPTLGNARFNYCITLAAKGQIQQAKDQFASILKEDQASVINNLHKLDMQLPESGQVIDFRLIYLWTAYKRQQVCNWADRQQLVDLYDSIADGTQQVDGYPAWMMFAVLSLPVKDATRLVLAKKVARSFQASQNITTNPKDTQGTPANTRKKVLNIAYIGGNFRLHPNFFITKGLYAAHNRDRVKVFIYALNKEISKEIEDHLVNGTDQFENVSAFTDMEVAQRIADDEIDILIDLGTYNDSARPGILAFRPAPVQVSMLGSEISSGADFFDYRITDKFLVHDRRDLWSEKLLYLPGASHFYDGQQDINIKSTVRSEHSLPDDAFVFCSFNNSFKIEPEIFACWCQILKQVDNSVLWLLASNTITQTNLKKHALHNGISPERLIFADRIDHDKHLCRHQLADLFLDSRTFNAHTTANESLWVGTPLITIHGTHSASRVAASILKSVKLDELVTSNFKAYEALAIRLATDNSFYSDIRARVAALRENSKQFDINFHARRLEAAYEAAWQQYVEHGEPADITITDVQYD